MKSSIFAGILGLLLIVSLSSLTTFPSPFDDEGLYASLGQGYATTGKFSSISADQTKPFEQGNGLGSRIPPVLFGYLGNVTGHNLATARAISFFLILLATFTWFFIGQSLGAGGLLASLLFFSTERVFYAAHVFRPEASLVLLNSVFILLVVRYATASSKPTYAGGRGVFNGLFMLAHGNGLVTAVINSLDILAYPAVPLKKKIPTWIWYALGTFLGAMLFYLIQIHDVGGWTSFRAQLASQPQYNANSIFETLTRDLKIRWGRELVYVGTSGAAKVLRWIFYSSVLAVAAYKALTATQLLRRLSCWSLLCFFGYGILVADKIDIHISEMIPFFLAPVVAWQGKSKSAYSGALVSVLLAIGVTLSLHHGLKYRTHGEYKELAPAINDFLSKNPAYKNCTIYGEMQYWFEYHERGHFIGSRYFDKFPEPKGYVLAIDLPNPYFEKKCTKEFERKEFLFAAYHCP